MFTIPPLALKKIVFPVPNFPLLLSHSDLMGDLRDDPNLADLFNQVLSDEMKSAAHGYFLKDSLLVRKWVPQGECLVGEEIVQIVKPTKLRLVIPMMVFVIISLLKCFYCSQMQKDVSAFIKT